MTYQKIEAIRQRIDAVNPAIRLEVDGGVKIDNTGPLKQLVRIPSLLAPLFGADDYGAVISAMRQAMNRERAASAISQSMSSAIILNALANRCPAFRW